MSDQFSPIRPKSVPLSHGEPESRGRAAPTASAVTWALVALLAAGLLVGVFYLLPAWLENSRSASVSAPVSAPDVAGAGSDGEAGTAQTTAAADEEDDEALPPFQQLQRQQARESAQEELARFVELQIELEENMQVGAWGAETYDQAKRLAAAGDEHFVREQFQESVASYEAATQALEELIQRGRDLLEESVARGTAALAARDQARAEEAFALAETIAPDDPRVAAGRFRTALLPDINRLMREARNAELAENWAEALAIYERVESLDGDTSGLEAAMDRVAQGRKQMRIRQRLSEAFAHLDDERFDAARSAFREVLDLQPGNTVAESGLEQVARQADVARINTLQTRAETAVAEERWDDAAALYDQVLEVDPTIQFAKSGRSMALAQQRTRSALDKIARNPERLSSDRLFREAREILQRAEDLEPRGARLASRIEDVRSILETYGNPVPVVLRSDNRTEVTVSTVGTLGSFEEKRLELRPGAYTVIGSSDGCRDVREQIVVRPNMNPVDIRCSETL